MTTTAIAPVPARARHVLASEWIKFRSVRSTSLTLLVAAAAAVSIGYLVTHSDATHWPAMTAQARAAFDPVSDSFAGLGIAQLAFGALGVLAISSEYATGLIRTTFGSVPRRRAVIAAKAAVVGVVGLLAGELIAPRLLLRRPVVPHRRRVRGGRDRGGRVHDHPPGRLTHRHDDWAVFAPGLKTLEDAGHLRSHILGAFEMAELATDPAERAGYLTFAVIGAGPTGVEVVGQIAELAHETLPREYKSVTTTEAKILLIEAGPRVLASFAPRLQRYAQRRGEKMGVEVWLNTMARDMDSGSVTIAGPGGDRRIPARAKIWAAGVQASPLAAILAASTGADTDRAGRVAVLPDCSLPGHPEVFAIGDMVRLNDLPGVAQPAIQEGTYVGSLIRARLAGKAGTPGTPGTAGTAGTAPFAYRDKGSMATIGHLSAVTDSFGMKFTGVIGYTMWGVVHVLYLVGWGNRVAAVFNWARALTFSKNRPYRTITYEHARDELAERHHQRE